MRSTVSVRLVTELVRYHWQESSQLAFFAIINAPFLRTCAKNLSLGVFANVWSILLDALVCLGV